MRLGKTARIATVAAGTAAMATMGMAATANAHAATSPDGMHAIGTHHAGTGPMVTHGSPVSPHIVGGTRANNGAYVQLVFGQGGGTYGCTGEAIGASWVLTARHCVDGDSWMDVYYSNDVNNPGTAHPADQVGYSPNGDVALVHLASPVTLGSYAKMANSYSPSGGTGTIYGYGLRANKQQPDHLYKANVNILGQSTDAFGGNAVHVKGIDGASNHGDSGGPLVVNGQIVGVCSTGDTADPGSDIHAGSNYANLTGSRSWIKQNSGI